VPFDPQGDGLVSGAAGRVRCEDGRPVRGDPRGRRGEPLARATRPRLIDVFMAKVEELIDRSGAKIRADVAHRELTAMGYRGSERSTRRAVAEVKQAWQAP